MPLIEVDTLQRVRDMSYDYTIPGLPGVNTAYFNAGRISSIETANGAFLISASSATGFAVSEIASNGGLEFIDAYGTSFDRLQNVDFGSVSLTSYSIGSTSYVYMSGPTRLQMGSTVDVQDGLTVLRFDADAEPEIIQQLDVPFITDGYGEVSSFGTDPEIVKVGGRDMMVSAVYNRDESAYDFHTFRIAGNGRLGELSVSETFTGDASKYSIAQLGNQTFVVAFGYYDVAPLQVLKLNKNGAMSQVFELPTSDMAIFNRITTDIETVEIGSRSFVVVSESTAGSILVYEIDKTGALHLVEQEAPGIGDLWGAPEALEHFEIGGDHYIAAAGYGRSLGVFQVSDGGALTEVDEFGSLTNSIARTYDLEVRNFGGEQFIFASTWNVDELYSFRFIAQDNSISGNNGANTRKGTEADDQIFGRGGNDTLRGLDGDDLIEGGRGNDVILGGDGQDNLFGGEGRDLIRGGDDYDFIFGDDGNDRLFGQGGNDYINGGDDADRVSGQDGNDRLFGGGGRDRIEGGAGNDTLTDGKGIDLLTGGSGADIFAFVQDARLDTITDYEDGIDRIDMTDFGRGLEFSDLTIAQSGNDVTITYMNDVILVKAADGQISDFEMNLSDFIFA